MSHAVVLVNVRKAVDVEAEVSKLMAPYDEDGTWGREADEERPASKWDWWVIGGRWSGSYGPDVQTVADFLKNNPDTGRWPGRVLDPAEGWFEYAQMGWFGFNAGVGQSGEAWEAKLKSYLESIPQDDLVVVVDYHV